MVRRNETGVPDYPTCVRSRLSGGRLLGTDGSMWLYRAVPLNPVVDAATPAEAIAAAEPILTAFDELAAMTHVSMARRATARGSYRQVHLLLMNVPTQFTPPPDHPIGQYLATSFANQAVDRRVLLFGVRIHDKVTSGGLKQAVDSVKETLLQGSVPLEDFAADAKAVSAALGRAGLQDASDADLMLASSWWTHGDRPDVVMMEHASHLHVFNSADDAVPAAEAGRDCSSITWDALDQYAMTFASVQDFDFEVVRADDYRAWWVPRLMQAGAIVVSLRGGIEPAKVTRAELRRRKKQFMDDLTEQAQNNKMERAEQQEALARLDQAEAAYSMDGAPPVLTDASIIVALDGRIGDIDEVSHAAGMKLRTMDYRQLAAMSETWPCSNIRANPHLHDLPAQTVACSGLPSISRVGDKDGAMVGLTEMDRQPAFLSPTAAAKADSLPLSLVAGATGSGKRLTLDTKVPTPTGWTTVGEIKVGDQVLGRDGKPTNVVFLSEITETPDLFAVHLSDGQVIKADREHQWIVESFADRHAHNHPKAVDFRRRWAEAQTDIEALEVKGSEFDEDHESTVQDLWDIAVDVLGDRCPWGTWFGVIQALDFVEAPYRKASRSELGLSGGGKALRLYPTSLGLKALAMRMRQSWGDARMSESGERRMTTGEMIEAGLEGPSGHRFSIRVSAPLDLSEADLPIDPYVLGAWLGDGSTRDGTIAAAAVRKCVDPETGISDQEHMIANLADFDPRPVPSKMDYVIGTRGLATKLRELGVQNNKHIPISYLRASFEQRLALLQGLMDTDGTVTKRGACQLALSDERLITGALELVRSLGIKATIRSYENTAPPTKAQRAAWASARRRTKDRYVIDFKTTLPVCRLPRKARRIASKVNSRTARLFVTKIELIAPEPARCIQVDNADHVWLCAGFVPQSNTQALLWLSDQYSRMGHPVVIVDPKAGSDHSAAVQASGGQVASLDDLSKADGVFDPLRFAMTKEAGVDMASSLLAAVNPWGSLAGDYETPLISSLRHGTDHGASCIGEALKIAERDGKAPPDMVRSVFALAEASPMFRACMGINPSTEALRVAEGITLIKVGSAHLELPEPGALKSDLTPQQRVSLALVRMMVFGSASALTGRQGVVMLDEAWVFTGAGKSEVERLGRLARSQGVLPMLFTQRVSDAVNAGLAGYISRGLILPIQDKTEAEAACELFELEPTPERMARITARGTMGGGDGAGAAPNWNSMRHLRDPKTGETLRGSVAIYADLHGRAVPVEILIPQSFMDRASTNPDDIRRREAAAAAARNGPPALAASTERAVVPAAAVRHYEDDETEAPLGIDDFDFDFD